MARIECSLIVHVVCKNVTHDKCLGGGLFVFSLNQRNARVSGIQQQGMNFVVM